MKNLITIILLTISTISFAQNYWGSNYSQLTQTDIEQYIEFIDFYYGEVLGYQITSEYKNQVRQSIAQTQNYMSAQDKQTIKNQGQGVDGLKYYWAQLDYNSRIQFRNQMLGAGQNQSSYSQNSNSNYNGYSSGNTNYSNTNSMLQMNQTHLNNMNAISDSGWGNSYEYEYQYDPNN